MEGVSGLISAARTGDRGALDRLLGLYRNYLKLIAETSLDGGLRAKLDPSDAVQDTMLKAAQRFDQFRGSSERELLGWLRQILGRHLTDVHRAFHGNAGRDPGRERSLDDAVDGTSRALHRLLAAGEHSPSWRARQRETAVLVADALAELGEEDRRVLVLRSLHELDWADVAHHMKKSVDAARIQWTRALQRLAAVMEGKPWAEP